MPITAAEQYAIELINRARLDPLGEMKRYGIKSLNDGLSPGTLSDAAKQVLAPQAHLEKAAIGYAAWIGSPKNGVSWYDLQTVYLPYHLGPGKNTYEQRIVAGGYKRGTDKWWFGENLTLRDYNGTTFEKMVQTHHADWLKSAGHRRNMLRDDFREIGYAQEQGTVSGAKVSVAVTDFASIASRAWVTGVAYADKDGDGFYSMGEGQGGLAMRIEGGSATTTEAAGGYGLSARFGATVTVLIGARTEIEVGLTEGNVKVDVVNGDTLLVSGDVTLVKGIADAGILGVGKADLTGSNAANALTGNSAVNVLDGKGGADVLNGLGGNDRLIGGAGNDQLRGGNGNDRLQGDAGSDRLLGEAGNDRLEGGSENDTLEGGAGNDTLDGGAGADVLRGGPGKDSLAGAAGADRLNGGEGTDTFVFGRKYGFDRIQDFNLREDDRLALDRGLLEGVKLSATGLTNKVLSQVVKVTDEGVLFDFGGGDKLLLEGLTTTKGLLDHIDLL